MKKLTVFICFVVTMVSCWQKDKKALTNSKFDQTSPAIHAELYGNWVGDFLADEYKKDQSFVYSNKINIKIIKINALNQVMATSIVAGNKRALLGTYDDATGKMVLKESGSKKHDGIFECIISKDTINGFWKAFDKSVTVTRRKFSLSKKEFVYNKWLMLPNYEEYDRYVDYMNGISKEEKGEDSVLVSNTYFRAASPAIFAMNASTTLLEEDSLKNLRKLDLEIIRNTIYARHGYSFNQKAVRQFFDPVEWYIPVSNNVEKQLTALELTNIMLLKRFEQYAEDKYEQFGR